MTPPETTAYDDWDAHWDVYASSASQNPAQQMRHGMALCLLPASPGEGVCLLDIGSGQGDFVCAAIDRLPKANFLGFELSESGVRISKKKAPTATFVSADLFHPQDALKSYEGWASHAICSEVLEHVDDPVAFLGQAKAYLSRDAKLIVTVPGGPMSAFDRHIGHRQHFTRESIRAILEKAGFKVERVMMAGFPFFNLYRLIVIARGEKLASDVEAGGRGASSRLAVFMMAVFRLLFRFNFSDTTLGWQVVAVARTPSPTSAA